MFAGMRTGEPLSRHSSWRIGGPADFFIEPATRAELVESIEFAVGRGLPWLIIGQGTNILFADAGYRGVVIKIGPALGRIRVEGDAIEAEAGVLACRLARLGCQAGLTGLEHVVGIPGTLGGLIAMNGGSLRQAIGDNLVWVDVLDERMQVSRVPRDACGFGYRMSRFQSEHSVLLAARLHFERRPTREVRRAMLDILCDRRRSFPRRLPNCGSVFRIPSPVYARAGPPGRIIEECGFKGRRVGDAEVSSLHANFINNIGQAHATDVLELIRQIREAVWARLGILLETEAKYVHPRGAIVPAHEAVPADGRGIVTCPASSPRT